MDTRRNVSQPRGAALVIAMLVMVVLLLAGTTFLTMSSTETQIALNDRLWTQASFLAEAAIQKAVAQLNADASYGGETDTPLADGKFTIGITPTAGCTSTSARNVVATASLPTRGGTVRVQIRTTVDRVSYPFRWATFATIPNGILNWDSVVSQDRTDKELWLADNSLVDSFDSHIGPYDEATKANTGGDIGANGDVTVDWDSQINGSIKAGDAISEGSGVTVNGAKMPQAATQEFPVITPDTTPSGDLWVSGGSQSLAAGTYHFLNMFFANDTSLVLTGAPVTIYVSGWVSLGSNVIIGSHPGTNLRLITKSDGLATESATFQAGDNLRFHGILYGKNTDVYLGASAQIYGSMIARTIYAGSFAKVHRDQAMSHHEICHNGRFTIRRGTWRQVTS